MFPQARLKQVKKCKKLAASVKNVYFKTGKKLYPQITDCFSVRTRTRQVKKKKGVVTDTRFSLNKCLDRLQDITIEENFDIAMNAAWAKVLAHVAANETVPD